MSVAVLFSIAKRYEQPTCLSAGELDKQNVSTHAMECYSALKKGVNSDTCYNTDEPHGRYAG